MTLKPAGDLTIFEVGVLCDELTQALIAHQEINVDVSEVDKIDASAVQLLLALRKSEHIAVTGLTDSIRSDSLNSALNNYPTPRHNRRNHCR